MFGIDLGTSCIRVSQFIDGKIVPMALEWEAEIISDSFKVVGEEKKGDKVVAKSNVRLGDRIVFDLSHENQLGYGPLRILGLNYGEEVRAKSRFWPYQVIRDDDGEPKVMVHVGIERMLIGPDKILEMILREIKVLAKKVSGVEKEPVFVIAIAGCSDFRRRRAVMVAARNAGMKVSYVLNDTTALAITKMGSPKVVSRVIFDLGCGSLTVSAVYMKGPVIQVKATEGDCHLGGEDIDNQLIKYLIKEYRKRQHNNLTYQQILNLRPNCEQAKRLLKIAESVIIPVTDYVKFKITREEFNKINHKLFSKIVEVVRRCLQKCKFARNKQGKVIVNELIMTGCASQIPLVQTMVLDLFDITETKVTRMHEARGEVSKGAAMLVAIREEVLKYVGFTVDDVLPRFGLENHRGMIVPVVPAGVYPPQIRESGFVVDVRYECVVWVKVYEGIHERAEQNIYLGGALIRLPPEGDGLCFFHITFEVDQEFIVTVDEKFNKWQTKILLHMEEGVSYMIVPPDNLKQLVEIDYGDKYLLTVHALDVNENPKINPIIIAPSEDQDAAKAARDPTIEDKAVLSPGSDILSGSSVYSPGTINSSESSPEPSEDTGSKPSASRSDESTPGTSRDADNNPETTGKTKIEAEDEFGKELATYFPQQSDEGSSKIKRKHSPVSGKKVTETGDENPSVAEDSDSEISPTKMPKLPLEMKLESSVNRPVHRLGIADQFKYLEIEQLGSNIDPASETQRDILPQESQDIDSDDESIEKKDERSSLKGKMGTKGMKSKKFSKPKGGEDSNPPGSSDSSQS